MQISGGFVDPSCAQAFRRGIGKAPVLASESKTAALLSSRFVECAIEGEEIRRQKALIKVSSTIKA
jgi:hypothetical protein